MSIEATARYLRAAERYDPELIAHEIIQLFSGMRADDEMADFMGEWVSAEPREVLIPAAVAKAERREVIDNLEENFWAWRKEYGRTGLLRPKNYEPRWKRIRVLASTDEQVKADSLAILPVKTLFALPEAIAALQRWTWNARRQTFYTYHVAEHQGADKTALILRHRGEPETLLNSHRGLGVTQRQGVVFFELMPAPVLLVIGSVLPAKGLFVCSYRVISPAWLALPFIGLDAELRKEMRKKVWL